MISRTVELLGTVLFALAVLHTFCIKQFQHLAHRFPQNSVARNFFHLLGEVEIVFGLWAGILSVTMILLAGNRATIDYIDRLNFTEPAFVFAIMTIAATRPVLEFANSLINWIARIVPLPGEIRYYLVILIVGPLLGSLITEPAAMTVTAILMKDRFFSRNVSDQFKYVSLAVLFVNISIGGALTSFAAPPVLMVAGTWQWNSSYMFSHFGWKAVVAVVLNTALAILWLGKELKMLQPLPIQPGVVTSPWGLRLAHLVFLALVVLTSHHIPVFLALSMFFLGLATVTREFQDELKLKESLLVAFFLAGLVVFGGFQRWWLEPLISGLQAFPLFLGTTVLTAFTDNAALTYLGSQLPNISLEFKHALVAGAVAGGGLTVIANAPNPAGFTILQGTFGKEGISPAGLIQAALIPSLVAMACLWWLPSL